MDNGFSKEYFSYTVVYSDNFLKFIGILCFLLSNLQVKIF